MKLNHSLLSCVAISSLFLAAGCVGPVDTTDDTSADDSSGDDAAPAPQPGSRFHSMRIQNDSKNDPIINKATMLTYYGGPVLQHVNVIPVYWNSTVANQASLNTYYATITNSIYFDWLSEYNTSSPSQQIGRGTAQAGFVNNNITTSTTEAKIQAELNKLFTNGSIPLPNANNYYAVHFPKNMSITASDHSKACVQWCAFHGTYVRNGVNVYYGVLPDVSSSGCAGGCGGNANAFNNETSVASHELVEATTDAAVGIATVYGPPLAWYNSTYGEIGDICNAQQGSVAGYTVQKQWSNSKQACITNY